MRQNEPNLFFIRLYIFLIPSFLVKECIFYIKFDVSILFGVKYWINILFYYIPISEYTEWLRVWYCGGDHFVFVFSVKKKENNF